jgi:hypothetical protein
MTQAWAHVRTGNNVVWVWIPECASGTVYGAWFFRLNEYDMGR